tara:strand:- start:364 stop:558 length:195 start_codon:yes stop_codon:yes gene_type:complete
MKVRVQWDFSQTELAETDYENALEQSGLPHIVLIPIDIAYEDEEGISDWISEEFGFTIFDWWEV